MAIFAPFIALWTWFSSLGWVRAIGLLVGIGFAGVVSLALLVNGVQYFQDPPEESAAEYWHKEPKTLSLPSDGPLGRFDRAQVQRGFQVYKEVCASCHALSRVHFYDLTQIGYSEAAAKKIASEMQIPVYSAATGEVTSKPGLISDSFPPVTYGGQGNPPDLSLITKAREGGAAYVYSLLTGYQNQPAAMLKQFPDSKTPPGLHFNPYFANLNIAMPPPLTSNGQVTYDPGNPKPTIDQMARDVAAFLVWTAEPKLENRHRAGLTVLIFLLVASALGYFAYQNVWAEAKRKVVLKGPLDPENKARRNRAKGKAGIAG